MSSRACVGGGGGRVKVGERDKGREDIGKARNIFVLTVPHTSADSLENKLLAVHHARLC